MKDQAEIPEALRLADICAKKGLFAVEDELRRLHAESEQHLQELRSYRITVENREARIAELEAQLAEVQQGAPAQVHSALTDARSVLLSINRGDSHRVKVGDDVCYWQRDEWVQWAINEVLPMVNAALAATHPTPQGLGAPDMDRVLSIADEHAIESREDGVRLLGRNELYAFAKDVFLAAQAKQGV